MGAVPAPTKIDVLSQTISSSTIPFITQRFPPDTLEAPIDQFSLFFPLNFFDDSDPLVFAQEVVIHIYILSGQRKGKESSRVS